MVITAWKAMRRERRRAKNGGEIRKAEPEGGKGNDQRQPTRPVESTGTAIGDGKVHVEYRAVGLPALMLVAVMNVTAMQRAVMVVRSHMRVQRAEWRQQKTGAQYHAQHAYKGTHGSQCSAHG